MPKSLTRAEFDQLLHVNVEYIAETRVMRLMEMPLPDLDVSPPISRSAPTAPWRSIPPACARTSASSQARCSPPLTRPCWTLSTPRTRPRRLGPARPLGLGARGQL